MSDLLNEVDTNIPSRLPARTVKTASRRKTRVLSPPISQEKEPKLPRSNQNDHGVHLLNTPPRETTDGDQDALPLAFDEDDIPMSDPLPSSPTAKIVERRGHQIVKAEDEDDDDMMEIAQVAGDHSVKTASVNISGSRPAPKIVKVQPYPSPESSSPTRPPADVVDPSTWNDVTSKLNVLSSQGVESASHGKIDVQSVSEADGSLRVFWTDFTEVNGSLCLFGKVKVKDKGGYASAFVKVDNILRKLFFLPRTHRHREYFRPAFGSTVLTDIRSRPRYV